jgi:hypothetical protein
VFEFAYRRKRLLIRSYIMFSRREKLNTVKIKRCFADHCVYARGKINESEKEKMRKKGQKSRRAEV